MLQVTARIPAADAPALPGGASHVLTLTFAERQKSRLRAHLADGTEVAVWLPRGTVLRGGDQLRTACGRSLLVRSAAESVSTARATDPQQIARACYHLGNRHVAVEILADGVRYLHDHVLDELVRGLGLDVIAEHAPFEPEDGAYRHSGGHPHSDNAHGHGDAHAHGDPSDHGHGHAH